MLSDDITRYVGLKRAMGFKFRLQACLLNHFAAFAEPRGALFVRYEALIAGPESALNWHETNRICDYLGVERLILAPLTQKLPKVRV